MALIRRDREHVILANGKPLMSSRMHGSEEALPLWPASRAHSGSRACWSAALAWGSRCGRRSMRFRPTPRSASPSSCPRWSSGIAVLWRCWRASRSRIGACGGGRRRGVTLRARTGRFDAILLDVDNGPDRVYRARERASLRRRRAGSCAGAQGGGVLAVWSAWEDRKFEHRLRYNGFTVEVEPSAPA